MKINIGKEGNQPFEIEQLGVSRNHATIEISDDGTVWTLTDNDSTNGTFIRESDGQYRRIASVRITPMTFIRLGPDTVHGCSFFAKRVLGDKKNYEYFEEFEEISRIDKQYEDKIAGLDKKASKLKLFQQFVCPVIIFGLLMLLPIDETFGMSPMMLRIVLTPVISGLIVLMFDPKKKVKQLKEERKSFYDCPNPKCSHKLKQTDIAAMSCSKCKAH